VKLEYLPEGSLDCPLIRIYDFSAAEIKRLHEAVRALAERKADRVAIDELPGVELVGGCRLMLCIETWDQAVCRVGASSDFVCSFRQITWENVAGLIEPFVDGAGGFQWLAGIPGEASLLLSSDGSW
jgi:hypothetical protein